MLLPSETDEEPLGALFARVGQDVSNLVHAEIDLYKQEASHRAALAKLPVVFIFVALFLAQASLTTILVGCALGLATLIGPLAGGLVTGGIGFAICGLLVWLAVRRLSAAFAAPGPGSAK